MERSELLVSGRGQTGHPLGRMIGVGDGAGKMVGTGVKVGTGEDDGAGSGGAVGAGAR